MSQQQGPVVYDKGKYHLETVENYGLPESHAYHHTLYFFRWLIEHDLMSEWFRSETKPFEATNVTNEAILQIFEWWDCCLVDDMLSEEGNAFALHYFDFEKGRYLSDYMGLLQGNLPSEYHIPLTEGNCQRLKKTVERRYADWKNPTPRPPEGPAATKKWWEFWR